MYGPRTPLAPRLTLLESMLARMRFSWQRLIFALTLVTAALAGATASYGEPKILINDVRVGQKDDHTRFVLDISGKVSFDVFTLADPYRIVVDFPEVGWRIDPAAMQGQRGFVKGYRFGLYRPGSSRLVIDLTGPATIANKFLLPPEGERGYRLVLDLAPTERDTYLKTAGWPKDKIEPEPEAEIPIAPTKKRANAKKVIVIDSGHGGVDPGATGLDGTLEKDIVLAVAKALRDALEASGSYTVVMTRDSDVFLSRRARVAVARHNGADLFISLHADSAPSTEARGASVYTLSEQASDKEAEALARAENQSDILAGVDLTNESDVVTSILIDLAQRETKNNSAKFAQMLIPELHQAGDIRQKTHRFAGFVVLKAPDVPSVLIELGYVTNRDDESAMVTSRWRRGMANAIARAVDRYFKHGKADSSAAAEH